MAKLPMLGSRIQAIDTRRIKPLVSETLRLSGATRVTMKRKVYVRDGGMCQLCGRVVDLCESELDHKVALQFGGNNEPENLWTLCIPCHEDKTKRENFTGAPVNSSL
ncbi:HNH endonuclease [Dryocola sp. LX212]